MGKAVPPTSLRSDDMTSRVLIVDDDIELSESLARLLGRSGHTCLVTASGSEATSLIEAARPDLVVTDPHMPAPDWVSVTRRARTTAPPIPVVLMTLSPMGESKRKFQTASGIFHVPKSSGNAAVVDVVKRALASSQSATGRALPPVRGRARHLA